MAQIRSQESTPASTSKLRRTAPSRKKACKSCSDAKVRCSLEKPVCARCRAQGKQCRYVSSSTVASSVTSEQQQQQQLGQRRHFQGPAVQGIATTRSSHTGNVESVNQTAPPSMATSAYDVSQVQDESLLGPVYSSSASAGLNAPTQSDIRGHTVPVMPFTVSGSAPEMLNQGMSQQQLFPVQSSNALDFRNIDLVPMSNAEEVRDHWMRSFFAPLSISTTDEAMGDDQAQITQPQPKVFQPFTLQSIACILKSYPDYMLSEENDPPPIIHPSQVAEGQRVPESLANCFSLVRMWRRRAPGSEGLVASVVKNEIERLVGEQPLSDFESLCTFQAYLIYLILAYFYPIATNNNNNSTSGNNFNLCDDSAMITLQELAFRTAKAGFQCRAEINKQRPTWESWIIASAKRRTLFVMYIFVSLYNAHQGVPNFVAEELKGAFVPESKKLWNARDRETWQKEYRAYLSEWDDGILEISELWRSAATGSERLRSRIARWLRGTDEFGMMLFMISAHIHGC